MKQGERPLDFIIAVSGVAIEQSSTVQNGYNQNWDLGGGISANRTMLAANNGTWPNIIKFTINGTNVVKQNGTVSAILYYQYGGSSNLTGQVYFDRDFNPYNSNSIPVLSLKPPATGTNSVSFYSNLGLAATNIAPGVYAVYAKISDGRHVRYLYASELVQIVSPSQPPIMEITSTSREEFVIAINGVSGQNIALQVSSDLTKWTSLATNTLTTGQWSYTNSLPGDQQFYRAVLLR